MFNSFVLPCGIQTFAPDSPLGKVRIGSQHALKAMEKEAQGKNMEFLHWYMVPGLRLLPLPSTPHLQTQLLPDPPNTSCCSHESCSTGRDSSAGMPSRIMQRGFPGSSENETPPEEQLPPRTRCFHTDPRDPARVQPGSSHKQLSGRFLLSSLPERRAKRSRSSAGSTGCSNRAAASTGNSTGLNPDLLLCRGL